MAIFRPTIECIKNFKVQPTEGEWTLLRFLEANLDNSFEVYFNPYLNGDRPDVVIMREGYGVLIIEVKDWNLDNFVVNERKKWIYTPNQSIVKSPIDQVIKYKENLYNLHVPDLLEMKINDRRHFSLVSCAVYFHCASQKQIEDLLITPFAEDEKYLKFLQYYDIIGHDSLTPETLKQILGKRRLIAKYPNALFSPKLYDNFKRILSPSVHLSGQVDKYVYSEKQKDIIYGKWDGQKRVVQLEQRVRGVFGSGKTTVLAARAVQAYKRALQRNSNPRILILTYNITLRNFIHDKINRVDEEFTWENFIVINYHQFINAELNNLNIDIIVPEDIEEQHRSAYLEANYYGNIDLFEQYKNSIRPYDAVLIDEIQDFHRSWMDIVKTYYRDSNGDYVLFGDVKQNIYGTPTMQKEIPTNVRGVSELKYCYRSDYKVRDIALAYQKDVYRDKYDIDNFEEDIKTGELDLQVDKEGYINYMYLQGENPIMSLYNIIRGNIVNKTANISPNDITVLGYTHSTLRLFDAYYRYASREKTATMMETIEAMYMSNLNLIGKESDSVHRPWFDNICGHLRKKLFPKKEHLTENDIVKLRTKIACLFTIYDLYTKFNISFRDRLKEICEEDGISFEAFLAYRQYYAETLDMFVETVYKGNYQIIQNFKKLHFWMNSGTIKIATINSFKGWESEVIFLIIEKKYDNSTDFNTHFDELLYTGITRCRRNLIIINYGNREYDQIIRPIMNSIK